MKFNYEQHSLKPGIYKIINTHTNRIYIGQAKRFKERWQSGHRCSLTHQRHKNKFLQADYNKCLALLGHDDFLEFHVLEVMEGSTKEERQKTEQVWLDELFLNEKNYYNLQKKASLSRENIASKHPDITKKRLSDASKGKTHSKEWNERISQSHKGKKLSEEHKLKIGRASNGRGLGIKRSSDVGEKISIAKQGKPHPMSEEARLKLCATYNTSLMSPNGFVYLEIKGLTDFAKQHNLSRAGLRFVILGQRKSHKGWKLICDPSDQHKNQIITG